MPRLPDTYRAVIQDQQRQLAALIRAQGVGPIRRMYEGLMSELTRKLRLPASEFGQAQLQSLLAQLKLGMSGIVDEMGGALGGASYRVGLASARATLQNLAVLERTMGDPFVPLPLLEISRLRGLVKDQTPSLLRFQKRSLNRYGDHLVGRFEQQLQVSLATGETGNDVIDRIAAEGDLQWYQAERIVRTELSYASNATVKATNEEQADELDGDMWSMWSEHVDDDGTPMDDRVGEDSLAMHGQVAPPGGNFTQPPSTPDGEEVSKTLVGQTWDHPPNRPNDRAVLTPWRAHWGVPGWIWDGGRRVPVTQEMADEHSDRHVAKRDAADEPPPEAAAPRAPRSRRRAAPAPEAEPPPAPEPPPPAAPVEMEESEQIDLASRQFSAMAPDERDGLTEYAAGGFREINASLRKGETPKAVAAIDRAFARPEAELEKGTTLYRGAGQLPEVAKLEIGEEFSDPAYASTSIRTRMHFWRNAKVRMVITAPKGTRVVSIGQDISPTRWNEREVLMQRGQRFKITHKETSGDVVTLHATALPDQAAVIPKERKNQKRVAAAKKAAEASAERRREIHSAARDNLPVELRVAWDKEGHKFMREEAGRIKGVKDRVNASSTLSQAFMEKYGSGEETVIGNEGDRFYKRAELEAAHAESWADEQEAKYYKAAQEEALRSGEIDESGELTRSGRSREPITFDPPSNPSDDDPPF